MGQLVNSPQFLGELFSYQGLSQLVSQTFSSRVLSEAAVVDYDYGTFRVELAKPKKAYSLFELAKNALESDHITPKLYTYCSEKVDWTTIMSKTDLMLIYPVYLEAIQKGKRELIRILVECGFPINLNSGELLQMIEEDDDLQVICWGVNPLHRAINYPDPKTLSLLIKLGADVNLPDQYGDTPLFYSFGPNAGEEDFLKVFEILINNGADPSDGRLLTKAAVSGYSEVYNYLLDQGTRPADVYEDLFYFIKYENVEMIELLLEFDVDVNARHYNRTSLFELALSIYASPEILGLLVEKGANVSAARAKGLNTTEEIVKYYVDLVESIRADNPSAMLILN